MLNAPDAVAGVASWPGTEGLERPQRDDDGSAIVCFSIMLKSNSDVSTSQSRAPLLAVSCEPKAARGGQERSPRVGSAGLR
jgi:hypothetical protein